MLRCHMGICDKLRAIHVCILSQELHSTHRHRDFHVHIWESRSQRTESSVGSETLDSRENWFLLQII